MSAGGWARRWPPHPLYARTMKRVNGGNFTRKFIQFYGIIFNVHEHGHELFIICRSPFIHIVAHFDAALHVFSFRGPGHGKFYLFSAFYSFVCFQSSCVCVCKRWLFIGEHQVKPGSGLATLRAATLRLFPRRLCPHQLRHWGTNLWFCYSCTSGCSVNIVRSRYMRCAARRCLSARHTTHFHSHRPPDCGNTCTIGM